MLLNSFTRHPASVGETYFEHLLAASRFGLRLVAGGAACILHGVFPFLFVRTGSELVSALHSEMSKRASPRSPACD